MKVGLNLTGVINWQSSQPFRNALKVANWGAARSNEAVPNYPNIYPHYYPATAGLGGHPLAVDSQGAAIPVPTFDADGYLTNGTGQGRFGDQTVYYSMPAWPPGTYNLRGDGDGDWTLTGMVGATAFAASGTFTNRLATALPFPSGLSQPQLKLTRTNPLNHVRNIQLMMPGYGFDDPLYLNDEFIASLSGFSCIRLMDWMSTNADEVSEWAQRMPATAQGFGGDNPAGGIPYETFGEIARRAGADLWINIPRRASPDWIAQFGAMMLATLPPTTTLYVEYANELWNGYTFQTALDNQAEAVASGLYDPALSLFERANRYAARRCRQTTMLMRQAFGASAGRVRDVFATMGGQTLMWGLDEWVHHGVDPGVTTRPSAPLATPNAPPHSAAVSSYMGSGFGSPSDIAATKAGGIDGMMASLNGNLLSNSAAIGVDVAALCASYGTLPMVYEGGFENFNQANNGTGNTAPAGQPSNATPPDPVMIQLAIDASRDLRIGPAATHELQVAANYYDLFMWFSHTSIPTSGGQYGLIETTFGDGPLVGTGSHASTWPKWSAVHALAAAGLVPAVAPPPPPVAVASLALSAPIASDRTTLAGTVTLSAAAPAGGLAVAITVDQVAVTVPATVVVPAGATTAQFALSVGDLAAPATATVRAAYTYSFATATLTLSPYVAPYALIPAHPLAASLEALYLFAERTGTVLHDTSGHGRTAPVPAGHWLTGPNLGAIALDGTYSIGVALPGLPKYPMTLALAGTMPTTSNTYLASFADDAAGVSGIRNDVGTDMDGYIEDLAFISSVTPRVASDTTTFHTLVQVIEAARQTFYVDGVAVPSAILAMPPTGRATSLRLGAPANGGGPQAVAKLSVVALASRAWTAADVAVFAAGPTAMVAAAAPPVTPALPAAPAGLAATAGNAQISITATPVPGAISYNLYRGTAAGAESATPVATGFAALPHADPGLVNGTTYYYKLAAVNAAGEGARSAEVSATPLASVLPPVLPAAPAGLAAAAGNALVSISATPVPGATSYNLYRGTAAGLQPTTPAATNITAFPYIDGFLPNGVTYYYKLTAVNAAGEGPRSPEVAATPLDPAPPPPPRTILRDDTALLAAAAQLEATGAFDTVTLVCNPAEAASPAQDARASAWLWRVGARQMDISDGVDAGGPVLYHGTEVFREVSFALRIGVREADPTARLKALCRLESVAYNAIQGTDLGGVVFPAYTFFLGSSDGLESVAPPEGRVNLAGQFKYMILSVNRFDEADADA